MSLSHDALRSIGERAADEVAIKLTTIEVASGLNEEGHPAYFFDLAFSQERDRARASLLRTRLRQKIRDLLIAENDARYPYIRIHGAEL